MEKHDTDEGGKESVSIPEDLEGEGEGGEKTEVQPEKKSLEEEFPEPKGLEQKDAEAFKTMRLKIGELREELKSRPTESERIKELEKQAQTAESKLEIQNFAASTKFQNEYMLPLKNTQAQLASIAKDYDIDVNVVRQAAVMPRKERVEFLREQVQDQAAISELLPLYNELAAVRERAQAALVEHQKQASKIQETELEETRRMQNEIMTSQLESLRRKNHFLLRESKQDPNWLKNITEKANALVNGDVEPEDIVAAAYKAQVADHYLSLYRTERAARMKAEEQLKKRGIVRPKVNARSRNASEKSNVSGGKTKSFSDLAEETISNISS